MDMLTNCFFVNIIMSRHQHGYPWPSLATSPYYSSPLAGLQGYFLCPHIAAVCKFELVILLLLGHVWGPISKLKNSLKVLKKLFFLQWLNTKTCWRQVKIENQKNNYKEILFHFVLLLLFIIRNVRGILIA